jgi:hypothetical protein
MIQFSWFLFHFRNAEVIILKNGSIAMGLLSITVFMLRNAGFLGFYRIGLSGCIEKVDVIDNNEARRGFVTL